MGAASTANLRFNARGLPSHVTALALLIPQTRGYATEHSTSNSRSSESFPPPGFNAEQAKKPIQKEEQSQTKDVQKADKTTTAPAKNGDAKESEIVKAGDVDKKASEKKDQKNLTIGQKIKKEVQHYWDGTKLLGTEVRISSRLALKMARGYELTRREHRQVGLIELVFGIRFRLTGCSSKERRTTWVGWSRSRCSLLSPLRNCFCPSL